MLLSPLLPRVTVVLRARQLPDETEAQLRIERSALDLAYTQNQEVEMKRRADVIRRRSRSKAPLWLTRVSQRPVQPAEFEAPPR